MHAPLEAASKAELLEAVAALKAMIPLALKQLVDFHPDAATQLLEHGATVQKAYRAILLQVHAHTALENEAALLLVAKNLEQTADVAVEVMKIFHFVHTGTKYEKSFDK